MSDVLHYLQQIWNYLAAPVFRLEWDRRTNNHKYTNAIDCGLGEAVFIAFSLWGQQEKVENIRFALRTWKKKNPKLTRAYRLNHIIPEFE